MKPVGKRRTYSRLESFWNEVVPECRSRGVEADPSWLVRTAGKGPPVYLYPDVPFWFVPDPVADELLTRIKEGASREELAGRLAEKTGNPLSVSALDLDLLLRSIRPPPSEPYPDRADLPLETLSELWVHLTDTCNLRCRHCLFRTTREADRTLEQDDLEKLIDEARSLGTRLICFTGGEPLTYPDFFDVVRRILADPDMRVAVLTNGILVPGETETWKGIDP